MAKLKDGFYKQTASSIGSDLLVLLAGGGAKPISDFASAFNVKLWGQQFDGSKDVSGNMTNVGSITFNKEKTFNIGNDGSFRPTSNTSDYWWGVSRYDTNVAISVAPVTGLFQARYDVHLAFGSGNVLIGTITNNDAKLCIEAGSTRSPLRMNSNHANGPIVTQAYNGTNSTWWGYSPSLQGTYLFNKNDKGVFISDANKVGINITSPAEVLHINGNFRINGTDTGTTPNIYLGHYTSWGGKTYPTLMSGQTARWVMHYNPHVVRSTAADMPGSNLRMESINSHYFDVSVAHDSLDTFKVRYDNSKNVLTISNTGQVNLINSIVFTGSVGSGAGTYLSGTGTDGLFLAANESGKKVFLESTNQSSPWFRNKNGDYAILHEGNYLSYSVKSKAWAAVTTKSAWSRILTISGYSNLLLSICFSQNTQASQHLYLISLGWRTATVVQLGYNNYSSNSTESIRITYTADTTFHVEVNNSYGYNGATSITFGCRATVLDSDVCTITPITTYTAGGGTVASSLTSSATVAMNFNADMVDGLHGSNLVRGGNIDYSPNMTSWLPGYPSFVGSAYNTSSSSWWNLISVRHRNGASDGDKYGMYIITSLNTSDNNLLWNKQNNGNWIGERTILDSSNYTSYCAPASHSHAYYPLSGNVNMSGDNVWIGSTMGGGNDYWRIGGTGSSDNGVCQLTIGDNSNDYFQIIIADYTGTNYTALQVKNGGTYAPHFYENSDQRLKENIKAILDRDNIPQIKEFDWKESGEHSYGLIAQELEEQGYSELVSTKDDGYKTVNYSAALSLIVGKLQVKIKELEEEIEILKKKN